MSNENWFYAINGQQAGPVNLETLRGMVAGGGLKPNDLVWHDGMPQWAPVGQVPELAPPPGAAPAQYPHDPRQPYAPPGYGGAYPQQHLNYYAPTQFVQYAGFWRRWAAAFLDGILVGIVTGAVDLILSTIAKSQGRGDEDTFVLFAGCFSGLFSLLVNWMYYALMESSAHQATLGKKALGIIVTDEAGQRISFGRATGRFFAEILSALILFIGFMMAGWTQRKQALHDMIAGTLVIKINR